MPTIKLLYALHCRLNRKANIVAQVTLKSETFQIEKIVMSKVMQNLVILKEQSQYAFYNSWKAGNMVFNRFCIDEDAAFELSVVNYLKKSSEEKGNEYTRCTVKLRSLKLRFYLVVHLSCAIFSK